MKLYGILILLVVLLMGKVSANVAVIAAATSSSSNAAYINNLKDKNCIDANLPEVDCILVKDSQCIYYCADENGRLYFTINYHNGDVSSEFMTWSEIKERDKLSGLEIALIVLGCLFVVCIFWWLLLPILE